MSASVHLSINVEGFEAFRRACKEAARAVERFAYTYTYATAAPLYLQAFGNLPGSERTSRLRKKRRDSVVRWWRANVA